jgi:hypothetical protein
MLGPILTTIIIQLQRVLLVLHLLFVQGSLRHPPAACCPAIRFRCDCVPAHWTCRHARGILEVHAHARSVQPHDGERVSPVVSWVREFECGELHRDACDAVQVSG